MDSIRPLTGTEIKQRRLSGRRQISTSGRKLIDGTPFGRPLLAPAPDRPKLSIPSRKRVKIGSVAIDDSTLVQVGSEPDDDTGDESYREDGDDDQSLSDSESEDEDFGSDSMSHYRILPARPPEEFSGEYDNPLMDYYYAKGEGSEEEEASLDAERNTTSVCGDDGSSEETSDESSGESSEEEEGLGEYSVANHNPGVSSEDLKERLVVSRNSVTSSRVGGHERSERVQEAAQVGAQSDSEEDSGDDCFEESGESEDEDDDSSFSAASESSVESEGIARQERSLESVGSIGSGDSDESEQSVGKAECQPVR